MCPLNDYLTTVRRAWRTWWVGVSSLLEVAATVVAFCLALSVCAAVMQHAHTRAGVALDDPLLRVLGPVNLRWPIFLALWASLAIGVAALLTRPARLLAFFQATAVLLLFRAVALYLTPLEPRSTIIPLADPIATLRADCGTLVLNDLFFSGHSAMTFLLFLVADSRKLKGALLAAFLFTGIGVVLQHVHYSIDVFAAPFFALGSWRLTLHARMCLRAGDEGR